MHLKTKQKFDYLKLVVANKGIATFKDMKEKFPNCTMREWSYVSGLARDAHILPGRETIKSRGYNELLAISRGETSDSVLAIAAVIAGLIYPQSPVTKKPAEFGLVDYEWFKRQAEDNKIVYEKLDVIQTRLGPTSIFVDAGFHAYALGKHFLQDADYSIYHALPSTKIVTNSQNLVIEGNKAPYSAKLMFPGGVMNPRSDAITLNEAAKTLFETYCRAGFDVAVVAANSLNTRNMTIDIDNPDEACAKRKVAEKATLLAVTVRSEDIDGVNGRKALFPLADKWGRKPDIIITDNQKNNAALKAILNREKIVLVEAPPFMAKAANLGMVR